MCRLFSTSERLAPAALDTGYQVCTLVGVTDCGTFSVAGLFAGIGGLELGLSAAGGRSELLCEVWAPAKGVLGHRFPGVPLVSDIRELRCLPDVDVVTAGFPCTDLSQAGRTVGIRGSQSGLVGEVCSGCCGPGRCQCSCSRT